MEGENEMISLEKFENILCRGNKQGVLQAQNVVFQNFITGNYGRPLIEDITKMPFESADVLTSLYKEGYASLNHLFVRKSKPLDPSGIPDAYFIYNGLLESTFVMVQNCRPDLKDEKNSIAIYTRCERLLRTLENEGAFEEDSKFEKNMVTLFGSATKQSTKLENALKYKDKDTGVISGSLALCRIDIKRHLDGEVSLETTVPRYMDGLNFYDSDMSAYRFYPYAVFPHLSNLIITSTNGIKEVTYTERGKTKKDIRALSVMQRELNGGVKLRRVCFNQDSYFKAYYQAPYTSREQIEEVKDLLSMQVKKVNCGWSVLRSSMQAFSIEASVYALPFTNIRLEKISDLRPVSVRALNHRFQLVDFNDVYTLFVRRVKGWKVEHFNAFSDCDFSGCDNQMERMRVAFAWGSEVDNRLLFDRMTEQEELFTRVSASGKEQGILEQLENMYNTKPKALKNMKSIDLDGSIEEKMATIRELLKKGACKITYRTIRENSFREYICTNNDVLLKQVYGEIVYAAYSSPEKVIKNRIEDIKKGKFSTFKAFYNMLRQYEIDGLVDYRVLTPSSTSQDFISLLSEVYIKLSDEKAERLKSIDTVANTNINIKNLSATNRGEYHRSLDVKNIVSVMYAPI